MGPDVSPPVTVSMSHSLRIFGRGVPDHVSQTSDGCFGFVTIRNVHIYRIMVRRTRDTVLRVIVYISDSSGKFAMGVTKTRRRNKERERVFRSVFRSR